MKTNVDMTITDAEGKRLQLKKVLRINVAVKFETIILSIGSPRTTQGLVVVSPISSLQTESGKYKPDDLEPRIT